MGLRDMIVGYSGGAGKRYRTGLQPKKCVLLYPELPEASN